MLTLLQHAWATVFLAAVVLVAAAVAATGALDADWAQVAPTTVPTLDVWGFAALSGIVNYSLPFWLYLVAIRSLPVGVAAQFLALAPVFGVPGGVRRCSANPWACSRPVGPPWSSSRCS